MNNNIKEVRSLAEQLEARSKEIMIEIDKSMKAMQEEKENWEAEKKIMADRYKISDNIIELNVGGTFYTTYKSVLTNFPESMLAAMFSGRHPIAKDSKGNYFLDCDGEVFGYILYYLRRGKLLWPDSPTLTKRLLAELNFLGVSLPFFKQSKILQPDMISMLIPFFPSLTDTKIIYTASVDGWAAQVFHAKTTDVKNTLTLIQVGEYVFGGFTCAAWNSVSHGSNVGVQSSSFLFSLNNPSKTCLGVKLPNTGTQSGSYSIYNNNSYGPTFGGGHDIHISDNCNANKSSQSNLGHSYSHPTFTYGSNEIRTFFCGTYNFTPTEIEIFALTL